MVPAFAYILPLRYRTASPPLLSGLNINPSFLVFRLFLNFIINPYQLISFAQKFYIHYNHLMNRSYFLQAAKLTTPVFFGYIAIGIPYGIMVTAANYPWWLAPIMSIFMYAGAGQYMAMGLFASGASLTAVAITQLFLNIRHIVYGLSLIEKFKNTGKWKFFLIFALTDETYALLTSVNVPKGANKGSFLGTIAALDYFYWILGGILGAIAGTILPFSFEGVDFALTALFAVLLINQLKATKDVFPVAVGISATILTIVLSKFGIITSDSIIILSITIGIAALMLTRAHKITNQNTEKTQNLEEK